MSSTEGSPAPNTPPFPSTPDIGVRAVIALPDLELIELCSPDDDAVETLPSIVGKVSEQFDNAFSPETPFDFVDLKCYPELDSDEEASTFRQALPQGQRNMAVVTSPYL